MRFSDVHCMPSAISIIIKNSHCLFGASKGHVSLATLPGYIAFPFSLVSKHANRLDDFRDPNLWHNIVLQNREIFLNIDSPHDFQSSLVPIPRGTLISLNWQGSLEILGTDVIRDLPVLTIYIKAYFDGYRFCTSSWLAYSIPQ